MITALQIIGGLILLFAGGELLVRGAVALAKDLGLSSFIIGLTVVAYGTSSPELIISVQSALEGHSGIALGNVIGSNIANILCVMGITAIIYPIPIDKKVSGFDAKIMLGVTAALVALCAFGTLNIIAGVIFLGFLIAYTYFTFSIEKKKNDKQPAKLTEEIEEQLKVKMSLWKAVAFCVAGLVLLMLGGDTLIKGSVTLAKMAGLSEAVIGVTLIAFGTSVPELVTSIVAAWHKKSDIVFGNIIGSNMFNILGILGITTTVSSISVDKQFLSFDLPFLAVTTIVLIVIMLKKPAISRFMGYAFLAGYAAYLTAQFWV